MEGGQSYLAFLGRDVIFSPVSLLEETLCLLLHKASGGISCIGKKRFLSYYVLLCEVV